MNAKSLTPRTPRPQSACPCPAGAQRMHGRSAFNRSVHTSHIGHKDSDAPAHAQQALHECAGGAP